jgi:heme/copper-type cytochrome/quinol oxidase subunit 2
VIMQSLDKSPSPFLKLGFTMIFFVVIIVVGFLMIPTYYLFRFSNQTKKGIDQKDEYALETGIASLRTYFTIFGVLGLLSLFISLIRLIMLAF